MRVNCVLPGFTDTAMVATVPEKVLTAVLKLIPLRRAAQPEGKVVRDEFMHFLST